MQWLRRSFIAGFFVTVPLFISVAAFIWIFGIVDEPTAPLYERLLGRRIPGLGIVTTAAVILLAGTLATNVIGKRVLQRGEGYLLRVPVFRTIYAPVKQLVVAFSPDNELGIQARGHAGGQAGLLARLPHEGVHGGPRARVRRRSWRCTCRPTTCTSATSSSATGIGPRFQTSRSRRASGSS